MFVLSIIWFLEICFDSKFNIPFFLLLFLFIHVIFDILVIIMIFNLNPFDNQILKNLS